MLIKMAEKVEEDLDLERIYTFHLIVSPDLLGKTPQGEKMTFAVKANIGCGHPASASTPSLRGKVNY